MEVATPSSRLAVRRLGWAGVELAAAGTTLLVDPLADSALWGLEIAHLLAPLPETDDELHVLVTHLHGDHFDPAALDAVLKGPGRVVCDDRVAATVASRGYPVHPLALHRPARFGPFTVTPVPAVDGFGIVQVSWVVAVAGRRFFHGGDTLWHGHWWEIGAAHGPFDAVFLPVNGFRYAGRDPDVDVPNSLTPEQAVAAATILQARRLVPIHHGLAAPFYTEEPDIEPRLREAVSSTAPALELLPPGAPLPL